MLKIYNPKSDEPQSLYNYVEYNLKESIEIISKNISMGRLIKDEISNRLIISTDGIEDNMIIKILPMVGGG